MRVYVESEPNGSVLHDPQESKRTDLSLTLLEEGQLSQIGDRITMPPMELRDIPENPTENPQATVLAFHTQIVRLEELFRMAQRTESGSVAWTRFYERRDQLDEQLTRATEVLGPRNLILAPSLDRLRALLGEIGRISTNAMR